MEEHVPDPRLVSGEQLPLKQKRTPALLARVVARLRRGRPRGQSGQAIVEYLLVLILVFTFTHQVFFNKTWGFRGLFQNTMFRLGSFLEQNLKSGTKVGGDGKLSLDPYAGTDRWSN